MATNCPLLRFVKKRICVTIIHWRVALFAWMGAIFVFSSSLLSSENTAVYLPGDPTFVHAINFVIRKFAHIAEYAILVYLWFRSLWTKPGRFIPCVRWSMLLSILYAMADEWHQTFVPSREGNWGDVVWDAAGVAMMGLVLWCAKRMGKGQWILGNIGDQ